MYAMFVGIVSKDAVFILVDLLHVSDEPLLGKQILIFFLS